MADLLHLDGSYGEGGGQLLRTALALSVLDQRPFRMTRIRAKRRNPGLGPQHLAAVRAMAQIASAQVEGAELGAREIVFRPGGSVTAGSYTVDVSVLGDQPSAGSVCLILQTLLLPLALRGDCASRLLLIGGTHVRWSPCYHYLAEVYLPLLARIGIHCRLELGQWGWYPQGGGELEAHIEPVPSRDALQGLDLTERGALVEAWGLSAASNLPPHVIERQASQMQKRLRSRHIKTDLLQIDAPSPGPGTVVFLLAQYEHAAAGFAGYGRLRYPAERVADDAFEAFDAHRRTKAPIDPHLADQIVLPLALARGDSILRTSAITSHLLSVIWLVKTFLDRRIEVRGDRDKPGDVIIW